MEIIYKRGRWAVITDTSIHRFETEAEAKKWAGLSDEPDWQLHIPDQLPLPEVREYDSMEEAIAEED